MLTLGPLVFAAPFALAALLLLPGLWWLLRLTPPAPRRIPFPPVRLLAGLSSTEESAARTPPWLLLLRLVLAVAVILGVARPLLNAGEEPAGSGPLVVIVDDGWAAGRDWPARQAMIGTLVDAAERQRRGVVLATTAAPAQDTPRQPVRPVAAGEARRQADGLQP
ncbi:MAG: BatA domain-containing protein, partial [Rhodospirillales bacterium]